MVLGAPSIYIVGASNRIVLFEVCFMNARDALRLRLLKKGEPLLQPRDSARKSNLPESALMVGRRLLALAIACRILHVPRYQPSLSRM